MKLVGDVMGGPAESWRWRWEESAAEMHEISIE